MMSSWSNLSLTSKILNLSFFWFFEQSGFQNHRNKLVLLESRFVFDYNVYKSTYISKRIET